MKRSQEQSLSRSAKRRRQRQRKHDHKAEAGAEAAVAASFANSFNDLESTSNNMTDGPYSGSPNAEAAANFKLFDFTSLAPWITDKMAETFDPLAARAELACDYDEFNSLLKEIADNFDPTASEVEAAANLVSLSRHRYPGLFSMIEEHAPEIITKAHPFASESASESASKSASTSAPKSSTSAAKSASASGPTFAKVWCQAMCESESDSDTSIPAQRKGQGQLESFGMQHEFKARGSRPRSSVAHRSSRSSAGINPNHISAHRSPRSSAGLEPVAANRYGVLPPLPYPANKSSASKSSPLPSPSSPPFASPSPSPSLYPIPPEHHSSASRHYRSLHSAADGPAEAADPLPSASHFPFDTDINTDINTGPPGPLTSQLNALATAFPTHTLSPFINASDLTDFISQIRRPVDPPVFSVELWVLPSGLVQLLSEKLFKDGLPLARFSDESVDQML
ncbi:uncharacterized protein L3040_008813 [Drepanopeziza brunnea f. sp. 'multigermtubi']|uniref:uncharacterized protein n=1 Tax=Drepanopeziza brunnea f. sp. 'multigermtubi' TaxID=698441 RepID=UPI00238D7A4C|nr:hypothetical protein L3040_008813 [Drepanopeziza brunnea f. sp. 'multigermtubi']